MSLTSLGFGCSAFCLTAFGLSAYWAAESEDPNQAGAIVLAIHSGLIGFSCLAGAIKGCYDNSFERVQPRRESQPNPNTYVPRLFSRSEYRIQPPDHFGIRQDEEMTPGSAPQ